jgi:hypothetical protein
MLLRRISEHIKAQDWFAVGIDFAIVVIGVYTAVAIESWAADRAQAKRTALVIETLRGWAICLDARFAARGEPGVSCRPHFIFESASVSEGETEP